MNVDNSSVAESERVAQLAQRVEALTRELEELRAEIQGGVSVGQPSAPAEATVDPGFVTDSESDEDQPAMSRRHALRAAGVLAAGAVAGGAGLIATAAPAAAAQGVFNGANPAVIANGGAGFNTVGVDAQVQSSYGRAVQGTSTGNDGVGVYGEGPAAGIAGYSTNGLGVYAVSATSHALFADMQESYPAGIALSGVYGRATNGIGVTGFGRIGLRATGDVAGVQATASEIGYPAIEARGDVGISVGTTRTAFRFDNTATSPLTSGGTYQTRDIVVDSAGDLWFCTSGGTPGTWRQLAGPATAGAFTPVTPARVYDSRKATYVQHGALGSGQNRTLSVANSYDLNGALVTTNFVPAGATAVFANIVVVETVGDGWLAINPGGDTTVHAASINWSQSGQILANGITLTLDSNRQITVNNGSAGSTQFVIDITGYYR